MRYAIEVLVRLKPGLLDPQGKAIEGSLPAMGWTNVSGVRVGKHVELSVEASSEEAARAQVEDMARRLLSNPVIEDFQILVASRSGAVGPDGVSRRDDPSVERADQVGR